jgi:putative hemolysin
MIGCASLEGTNPRELALPLSFLHHFAPAPEQWHVRALPNPYVEMNRISREHIDRKLQFTPCHRCSKVTYGLARLSAKAP